MKTLIESDPDGAACLVAKRRSISRDKVKSLSAHVRNKFSCKIKG